MNTLSRSYNSIRNIVIGFATQIMTFLLSFILRTFFIYYFGKELLGVNGLYSNILTILSLAELGLGTVMIYSLYKPIKEQDQLKITQLLYYFKKLYHFIALVMLVVGLLCLPILPYFIVSDLNIADLRVYYVLFLLNTVCSYFNIYKTALINADQKQYLIKNVTMLVFVITSLVQIGIAFYFQDYRLYLMSAILSTLTTNYILGKVADKRYPFIKQKVEELSKEEKTTIFANMKSMFLYKIGVVIMNNTDNILISKLVGTVWVGLYSNYGLFVNMVNSFINTFLNAIFASLGNLNAGENQKRKYEIFEMLLLLFHWLAAFCSICFIVLFNDTITLWIGKEYLFDELVIFAIVFNFYLANIVNPVWMYRETTGLFHRIKYTMLISSIINLVLSIVLGKSYGIFGILMATAVSRLLTTIWYEPYVLFKDYFKIHPWKYYQRQLTYIIISVIGFITTRYAVSYISNVSFINLIVKLLICIILFNTIFLILTYRSKPFRLIKENYIDKRCKRGK